MESSIVFGANSEIRDAWLKDALSTESREIFQLSQNLKSSRRYLDNLRRICPIRPMPGGAPSPEWGLDQIQSDGLNWVAENKRKLYLVIPEASKLFKSSPLFCSELLSQFLAELYLEESSGRKGHFAFLITLEDFSPSILSGLRWHIGTKDLLSPIQYFGKRVQLVDLDLK